MLTMPADWLAGLSSVVAVSTEPWLLLPSLVLITFLLEDIAIAAGVALALNGTVSWEAAFAAVAGGIALGDLGLYGMGHLAIRIPAFGRWRAYRREKELTPRYPPTQ
jgi:membrane protein DedA with SNARE-associated domain